MPKLFTNRDRKIVAPAQTTDVGYCINSYDSYLKQRVIQKNISIENIENLTADFKTKISDPIHVINNNLEMGQYFVIPVSELREMLGWEDTSDQKGKPAFIHICNALREMKTSTGVVKTFPVTILVPIEKNISTIGEETYKVCNNEDSVFIEAYPCPPDPRCPQKNELVGIILKDDSMINNFNSLL
jgi:hypothetical protein